MISHNMLFDGCIAKWIYGYEPKMYGDTLAMARATLASTLKSFTLHRVGVHLGVGGKIEGVLPSAKGRNFESIRSDVSFYLAYVAYALNDDELCARIFDALIRRLPVEELAVIDMLCRAVLQPGFVLDPNILHDHLRDVERKKEELLFRAVGADRSALMSNQKFAGLLRGLGIEPPTKISPATGQETYAFAKTDPGFRELLEHPDPQVQALVAARLGIKSTIEETRTRRFLAISALDWSFSPRANRPWMPVPLRYGAAHTHRFGGEWDLNLQNLGRGGKLRKSMKVEPGWKVVKVDASQIEARLTAWLAGEIILLDQFDRGEDPYCKFGTQLFGFPVTKETVVERTLAKSSVLGCGFQMGWMKFMNQVNAARLPDGKGGVIRIDEEMARALVYGYRRTFWHVPQFWQFCGNVVIPCLAGIGPARMTVGPIVVEPGRATLPSLTGELEKGLTLQYPDLRFDGITGEWSFQWQDRRKKLYPGKVVENFVQALDRAIVIGAAVRLRRELHPYILQHQAHDENIYIVPELYAAAVGERVRQEMASRPPWGPDLPLAAEVKIADAYG